MQVTNVVFNSTASPGDKTIIDPPAEERKIIVDLLKEEKVAEATRYSEGLITAYPRSFMLFYSLEMSCLLLDEAEKARVYLKRATKLNPGVADPWLSTESNNVEFPNFGIFEISPCHLP